MEVGRLKQELVDGARNRDEEYQANTKQIRFEMARQFQYGWVQGQQPSEHRFVAGPDDYDDELEFDPAGYELFQGMHRDDRPPTGYIPHRRIPLAALHGLTHSGARPWIFGLYFTCWIFHLCWAYLGGHS
ncbi:hypothetical protein L3X38_037651 [Prunus dulcis]|uniref:Uncharacterized protein n=1 Tax=Prunus dulcis TaxID=3755 RepID=A0AAD4V527_PRUDU|nr:hypothetical protein L3X38_037651 [Prunus dulcis]